jgi:hypothetical protein
MSLLTRAVFCLAGALVAGCGAVAATALSPSPPVSPPTPTPTPAPTPTPTPTPDPTAGWPALSLPGAATLKYPPAWQTYDCGAALYYPGEHSWWLGPDRIGGCVTADADPAPIELTVAAQLRPADTDTSGCGGAITKTQVTVQGVTGTRYTEGRCTTTIQYLDRAPAIYYVFSTSGKQFLFEYLKIGQHDLTNDFETMVEQGLHFTS